MLLAGVVLLVQNEVQMGINGSKTVGTYRAVRAGSVLPSAFPGKRSLGFYLLSPLCNERQAGRPGASIHMADV